MKKIVWALFDDSYCCWGQACQQLGFECYCIGIGNFKGLGNNHKVVLDLSLTNPNLIKELSKLPKPDIIVASPPCESWSNADCNGRMVKEIGKEYLIINNKEYYEEYNKTCAKNKKRNFIQKETSFINGLNTIGATIKIIEHFIERDTNDIDPQFWVIENPTTSKIWDYLKNHHCFYYIPNKTYYSSYNSNFSLKPTTFSSNIHLNLKQEKKNGNDKHMLNNGYDVRSKIPLELTLSILWKLVFRNSKQKQIRNWFKKLCYDWNEYMGINVYPDDTEEEEYNINEEHLPKYLRKQLIKLKDIWKKEYGWTFNFSYACFCARQERDYDKKVKLGIYKND